MCPPAPGDVADPRSQRHLHQSKARSTASPLTKRHSCLLKSAVAASAPVASLVLPDPSSSRVSWSSWAASVSGDVLFGHDQVEGGHLSRFPVPCRPRRWTSRGESLYRNCAVLWLSGHRSLPLPISMPAKRRVGCTSRAGSSSMLLVSRSESAFVISPPAAGASVGVAHFSSDLGCLPPCRINSICSTGSPRCQCGGGHCLSLPLSSP